MLYPQNDKKQLDKSLFENPTSEYRGTPFWAWNCKLTSEELLRQIDYFKVMGMGGFHMHVRTGMASPYLNEEFMGHVRTCVEKAKKENMLAWLYDEDRWPSGTAGGIVTKNRDLAMRNILFTPTPYGAYHGPINAQAHDSGRGGAREENGTLVAVYDVVLGADGTLASYRRIGENDPARGTKWYAYNEQAVPSAWFNNEPYVNTLDKKAIERFVEVTHERYYAYFSQDFGKTIPAIFTDEPAFAGKGTLGFASEKKDVFMPWTNDMPELFRAHCGLDLLEQYPELFWELPDGKISTFRYHFHDFVAELFASAFCDTVGSWCDQHGIMLGGHLLAEETLQSQTARLGEAMRGYRAFTRMPGIDMLCDRHEYNTAKQCQSALHQQGGEAMLSELYGVTGWDYEFRGHKLQGDWQAALGVTVRVPHLTWMSMKGEAKRDYPASIGYQSPWWDQYRMIEDHFSRLNTAMTRGKPQVKVGVVHPIESYWLHWGPSEQTAVIREQLENNHSLLTEILLFGMIDFDFISESRLPQLCQRGGAPLKVGEMAYDVVIVPACHTLRASTMERLEAFRDAGGKLIFLGDCPQYVDAAPSDRPRRLFQRSRAISFNKAAILDELETERFVDMRTMAVLGGEAFKTVPGSRTEDMIHQLRRDGDDYWLFIAMGKNPISPDVDPTRLVRITLNGEFAVEAYDTLSGKTAMVPARYENGKTILERPWYMHDSMLVRLQKGRYEGESNLEVAPNGGRMIARRVPVRLSEPNALLLDLAEYALDDEPLRPQEELLRLDNECRVRLGIPIRKKHVTQPYLIKEETPAHSIRLRMVIPSEVVVEKPQLALEDASVTKIRFNGQDVPSVTNGWYVDRAIETVDLPPVQVGDNVLELVVPLGERTNLEWFYLIGDFGVRVDGQIKTVIRPVRELAFGSFTHQGLPFYTGNVTYDIPVQVGESGTLAVRTEQFRGALIGVDLDGRRIGAIAFSPYLFKADSIAPGAHQLSLTLYGTRQNGFAQLHHTQGVYFYQSPDSWRSRDSLWLYEYQLKPFGILKSPQIFE